MAVVVSQSGPVAPERPGVACDALPGVDTLIPTTQPPIASTGLRAASDCSICSLRILNDDLFGGPGSRWALS